MKVWKLGTLAIAIAAVMIGFTFSDSVAEEKTWSYGGVEYKLPNSAGTLQIPPNTPEFHTVVAGDCLWAISNQYLADPFLWPLVWEENIDSVTNPHRIFPDQQIKLPGGTLVASGATAIDSAPATGGQDSESSEDEPDSEATDDSGDEVDLSSRVIPVKPHPVTSLTSVIASGFIAKDKMKGAQVVGSETESLDLARPDIVFVNAGTAAGFEPDKEYFVIRRMRLVEHPVSGKKLGWLYNVMGDIKVLCASEDSCSAIIRNTYHPILRSDLVIPKEEIPVPLTSGSPVTDPCNPSSKKLPGTIVEVFYGSENCSDAAVIGRGDIAYIDLGSKDNVGPGDYFAVFKRNLDDPSLPRYVCGEAMVVRVGETTSTIVLTQSKTGVFIGDQIELKQ